MNLNGLKMLPIAILVTSLGNSQYGNNECEIKVENMDGRHKYKRQMELQKSKSMNNLYTQEKII